MLQSFTLQNVGSQPEFSQSKIETLSIQFSEAQRFGNDRLAHYYASDWFPEEKVKFDSVGTRAGRKWIGQGSVNTGAWGEYHSAKYDALKISEFLSAASMVEIVSLFGPPSVVEHFPKPAYMYKGPKRDGANPGFFPSHDSKAEKYGLSNSVVISQWYIWNGKTDGTVECINFTIGWIKGNTEGDETSFRSVSKGSRSREKESE